MAGDKPTTLSILTAALQNIGAIGAAEDPSGEDIQLALRKHNAILGRYNTRRRKCFFERFQDFTFSTARTSYTIGPASESPNFEVDAGLRPAKIDRAQIVMTDTTPNTLISIPVYEWYEYANIPNPSLSGEWPIVLYYAPTLPNGTIYPFYDEPSQTSYKLRLWWWNQLETVALDDIATSLDLPFGLELVLELEDAVALAPVFGKTGPIVEELKRQLRVALADYESLNVAPTKISSVDGVQSPGGTFDYRSRTWL